MIGSFVCEKENGLSYIKTPLPPLFDVEKIFDCGQCFRFDAVENTKHEKEFSGIAFGRIVSFAEDGGYLYIYNSDERDFLDIWQGFLGLSEDYSEIDRDILKCCPSRVMNDAIEHGGGIRILHQDRFEALISFIISQNNNIPRIKKIIEKLSERAGKKIDVSGMEEHLSGKNALYSFPDASAILSLGVDGLFELKTGFRARYIYDAVEKIVEGEVSLDEISSLDSTRAAITELCRIKGVGEKVASCTLLFGFGRYDAFPIDVWIKRVANKYFSEYGDSFSPEIFGRFAGVAQQYLFYYERYLGGEK